MPTVRAPFPRRTRSLISAAAIFFSDPVQRRQRLQQRRRRRRRLHTHIGNYHNRPIILL